MATLDDQHVYQGQGGRLKLLLTSAGITNDSIRQALVDMLAKPLAQSNLVCIPTAIYPMAGGNGFAWQALKELGEMGWKELAILELTTMPSILEEHWLPTLEAADVIWVSGGITLYLSYWMQTSGLAKKLPELLRKAIYVGVSAGSMNLTRSLNISHEALAATGIYYDDEYDEAAPPNAGSDKTLKLVNFVLRPHLNANYFPAATLENMEKWAAKVEVPLYAIDDQTAIKVVDGTVEVISEGEWKLFEK
jgi:dipeptidase E